MSWMDNIQRKQAQQQREEAQQRQRTVEYLDTLMEHLKVEQKLQDVLHRFIAIEYGDVIQVDSYHDESYTMVVKRIRFESHIYTCIHKVDRTWSQLIADQYVKASDKLCLQVKIVGLLGTYIDIDKHNWPFSDKSKEETLARIDINNALNPLEDEFNFGLYKAAEQIFGNYQRKPDPYYGWPNPSKGEIIS